METQPLIPARQRSVFVESSFGVCWTVSSARSSCCARKTNRLGSPTTLLRILPNVYRERDEERLSGLLVWPSHSSLQAIADMARCHLNEDAPLAGGVHEVRLG